MRKVLKSECRSERQNQRALGLYNASVGGGNYIQNSKSEKTADNFKESIKSYLYDEEQAQKINAKGYDLTSSDQKKIDNLESKMHTNVKTLAQVYNMSENEVIGNINAYSDKGTRKQWFIDFKKRLTKK